MEPVQPEFRQVNLHGIPLLLERRVFSTGRQRELVYFTGLVAGQPLPYRLDHNLSVGMRHALHAAQMNRDQLASVGPALTAFLGIPSSRGGRWSGLNSFCVCTPIMGDDIKKTMCVARGASTALAGTGRF